MRILIGHLDKNQHIELAHVNPKCFDLVNNSQNSISNGDEQTQLITNSPHCSMWFIGLEFERTKNLNVDLTESIQYFNQQVHKQAVSLLILLANKFRLLIMIFQQVHIKMLQDGMLIEVRHVKRKQLNEYLESDFLKQEKRTMENHNEFNNTLLSSRKRFSSELAQSEDQLNHETVNTQKKRKLSFSKC